MLIDDHFREAVLNDTPAPYNSIVEQIDASAEGEEKQFDMGAESLPHGSVSSNATRCFA